MKVLAVAPAYPPDSRVGAWMATHGHLVELVRRGHGVAVRTSSAKAYTPYSLDRVRVSPLHWSRAGTLTGIDVVVSHYGDLHSRADEYAAARGIPHVTMVHGGIGSEPTTDLVVFNSEASRRAAAAWDAPSIVCHPRVDRSAHETETGNRVTLVNLSQEKGGHILRRIAARMPHHRFLGIDGCYGSQVRIPVDASNIEVWRPQMDMRRVWSQTRVLLMPSIAETWGMVGVEAMCSGIPVIAHPTPGLRESLGAAGVFVDRGDIYGWQREIERLDDPDIYAARSKLALQRAAELTDGAGPARFADEIERRFV